MATDNNNNENKVSLTKEDLAEAKAIIENLIKTDKDKLLFLSSVSSLLNFADTATGKLSAKSLYFLVGNAGAGGLTSATSSIEEVYNQLIYRRVAQQADIVLHEDYDKRSRNERSSINPEQTNAYSQTLSNSAATYLFQKSKMIKSYTSAAAGVCLTAVALASNPPLAAAVIGGSFIASAPLYLMNKRLKTHKVSFKNKIDEEQKKLASYSRQMYQNSKMRESAGANEYAYQQLADRQQNVMQKVKDFTNKLLKYCLSMTAWQTACIAGTIGVSVAAGLPLAASVLATAGAASTLAATNRILSGHYGKKEYIETFAMTYKKFKSTYKDFQFGTEKVNTNANILQLDHIAYRHRVKGGEDADKQPNTDLFRSNETITFKNGISLLSGASGSGKSTLTELLLHAANVNDGSIKIGTLDNNGNFNGTDYHNLAMGAACQNIAVSYQRPELIECSVDTYIKLGNPNADPEKVEEIKKLLGIGKQYGGTIDDTAILTPGAALSGGEQTRIGLAQALIKDSPIMILDEPTSGVDEKMSENIVNYLKAQKDKTIIYITHDPREIDAIGAYQAVDIGKHSKSDEVNTIKSYDLTDPDTKKDFIEFFSNRNISEKESQEERKQTALDRLGKARERQKNLTIGDNPHEKSLSGKDWQRRLAEDNAPTIDQSTVMTLKKIREKRR